jgi:hypothetical protein
LNSISTIRKATDCRTAINRKIYCIYFLIASFESLSDTSAFATTGPTIILMERPIVAQVEAKILYSLS